MGFTPMLWLFQTLMAAAIAFTATNLDDIVVLMLLFSQVPNRFSHRQIVAGQYLGFALLVGLSLPGFFGGLMLPAPWIGLLGIVPIVIGISALFQQALSHPSESTQPQLTAVINLPLLNPQVAAVAALTVANGGDNIGVYVPLFAGQSWAGLGLTLMVFAALVGVWCGVADRLVRHPAVSDRLTQYGTYLVPPILIGLGGFILWKNETYRLF
jgi:cadmium resistance transport/sequestration family protein